jgi:TrmH family RNA methyltransferase
MITKNQVKYIQSLGQKKSRDEENCFIAEGPKLVNELLTASNCKDSSTLCFERMDR